RRPPRAAHRARLPARRLLPPGLPRLADGAPRVRRPRARRRDVLAEALAAARGGDARAGAPARVPPARDRRAPRLRRRRADPRLPRDLLDRLRRDPPLPRRDE